MDTNTNRTISGMKQDVKTAGSHYFDKESIQFFASRILTGTDQFGFFIESQKKCFDDTTRVFKIRYLSPSFKSINSILDSFETKYMLNKELKKLKNTLKLSIPTFGNREKLIFKDLYSIEYAENYPNTYKINSYNHEEFLLHADGRIVG